MSHLQTQSKHKYNMVNPATGTKQNKKQITDPRQRALRAQQIRQLLHVKRSWPGHPAATENRVQQTECTPVQQDDDSIVGNVPLQHRSNDQWASPPALPALEHPAEGRLARGSAPDGDTVREPDSP